MELTNITFDARDPGRLAAFCGDRDGRGVGTTPSPRPVAARAPRLAPSRHWGAA